MRLLYSGQNKSKGAPYFVLYLQPKTIFVSFRKTSMYREKSDKMLCINVLIVRLKRVSRVLSFIQIKQYLPMPRTPKKERRRLLASLKEETKHGVLSIVFFVLSVFFILAAFGKAGVVGSSAYRGFEALLGFGYIVLPLLLLLLSASFLKESRPDFALPTTIGAFLFLLSALGIIDLFGKGSGGILGGLIATPLIKLFDTVVSGVFLAAILIISLLVMFDTKPSLGSLGILKIFSRKKEEVEDVDALIHMPEGDENLEDEEEGEDEEYEEEEDEEDGEDEEEDVEENEEESSLGIKGIFGKKKHTSEGHRVHSLTPFSPPPLSLLEGDRGKPGTGDIKAHANIIKRTLQNFGVDVEMDEISIGPAVTRYALKPAEGVKLARIVGLQNDLALALAAHPIRIEAPIPGKSLVGIEVPNTTRMTVGLRALLSAEEYQESKKPLLLALGRGVSGKLEFGNLAKMPHLLIAGSTGSGKSVTIHTMVNSLLFRNSPENLRFIMVDPKRVELTFYNDTPHLLTPVITDPKKAILALKWAAKEMDRRYDVLETERVRDIESYHENVVEPAYKEYAEKGGDDEAAELPERMPYIVVIIDELADIMTAYPRELESAIVRLAQMSRAVGIHLILSTQRPSVNVITGLIKANIPSRVALQVTSQIDSRTILDSGGAEKLLGAGDMLYMSGEMSKPHRLQSAFMSENEVKKVVKYIAKQYSGEDLDSIDLSAANGRDTLFETALDDDDGDDDELYEDAREVVINTQKASTSYLQRKLKVGYARAARLMDMLEERGVVGPQDGAKPREVLEKPVDHISEE